MSRDVDAEVSADDLALGDELLHDGLREAGGDGEPDAGVVAGARLDGGVDADDLALRS